MKCFWKPLLITLALALTSLAPPAAHAYTIFADAALFKLAQDCLANWPDDTASVEDRRKCHHLVSACELSRFLDMEDQVLCRELKTAADRAFTREMRKLNPRCPYDPKQPSCVYEGTQCPANLLRPGPGGFFNYGGYTWDATSSGEGYAKLVFSHYRDEIYSEDMLIDGMRQCPQTMRGIGELFVSSMSDETKLRSIFVDNMRIDGYRLERKGLGWKLWTPNGYSSSAFGSPPKNYEQYRINKDKVFTTEITQTLERNLTEAWIAAFQGAFKRLDPSQQGVLYPALVDSLKRSRSSAAQDASKVFTELERALPGMANADLKLRLFEFPPPGAKATAFGAPEIQALVELLALPSPEAVFAAMESKATSCRMEDLESALRSLRLLEDALAAKRKVSPWQTALPPSRLGKIVADDHWLLKMDTVEGYRRLLARVRDCAKPYALVRRLYQAYEDSVVSVSVDLYLQLMGAGSEAYQKEFP
ncbi:MAG: hypothetical protein AB7P04_03740 [Bacteriovoracia bacterium]